MIDTEIEAQRAEGRIQDHHELVKQYQKVVRAYNNFMRDYHWMTEGLMQDNCQFGDMLKDERERLSLNMNWEDLWVSMQYPYLWATST